MSITSFKTVAAIGALSSTVILSGCSIPFIGGEEPAVSTKTAQSEISTNPEKVFFDFAKASGKTGLEKIGLTDFDKELLTKSKADIDITGDFNMEGTPIGGGTGTFEIGINTKADYSDQTNPLLSEIVSTKIDALGGLFKLDTSTEIRIVNKSVFANISQFNANFPGLTDENKKIIQKFVGQWYGNTFEEINTLVSENLEVKGFDIQKILTGGITPISNTIDLIKDIGNNPQNHITFEKFIEEKDGYYFFEVTPKKETYEKFANIITTFIANSGAGAEADEETKKTISEALDKISTESVTLAYTPEHPEYFQISKTIDKDGTKVVAKNTSEGLMISILKKEGDYTGEVVFTKTSEGKVSLIVDIPTEYNGERTELLSGTCTDTQHTFSIIASMYDYELGEDKLKEIINVNLTKTGDIWAGEITSPELKDGKLVITDAKGDMYNSHAKISAIYSDKTITNVTFDIKSSKPTTVKLDTPENTKPFETIPTDIEKEMNALYGIKEVEVKTEEENSVVINNKNIEVNTENAEVVIDDGAIEVKTDAVKAVIDTDAQGGADYSEIQADLARMAELTSEDPNNEDAKNEFLTVKAKVDAYAAENDIPKEKLREMLMQEIVKQAK